MEHAEELIKRAGFPDWNPRPIANFALSASGVVALADLSTIAQRTAIVGGSSWLDAFALAPGLHYQQAADMLAEEAKHGSQTYSAVELNGPGKGTSTYNITNPATLRYLQRIGRVDEMVTIDVGRMPERRWVRGLLKKKGKIGVGQRATIWQDSGADLGWFSHALYLTAPVLTIIAFVFMILLKDFWGLSLLLALMLSRTLNIVVINARKTQEKTKKQLKQLQQQHGGADPDVSNMLTEYMVDLGAGRMVCLRGLADDLQAVTTSTWLKAKTHIDGYMEAMAKLIVYIVAALSGNMTQAGAITFMGLLLVTAGLLGLSNANAKTFRMNGRMAAPTHEKLPLPYPPDKLPYPVNSGVDFNSGVSFPAVTRRTDTGLTAMTDFAEKGQVGQSLRSQYPFSKLAYN